MCFFIMLFLNCLRFQSFFVFAIYIYLTNANSDSVPSLILFGRAEKSICGSDRILCSLSFCIIFKPNYLEDVLNHIFNAMWWPWMMSIFPTKPQIMNQDLSFLPPWVVLSHCLIHYTLRHHTDNSLAPRWMILYPKLCNNNILYLCCINHFPVWYFFFF